MKIGFDCRYVRFDHHDGISRFSARLVEALGLIAAQAGHEVIMIISNDRQLEQLPKLQHIKISSPTSAREPFVARQVNKHHFDIVFTPMQTMGSWFRNFRFVVTVHDLIYYAHRTPPRQFNFLLRLLWRLYHLSWWPQRLLLNRSDSVVAVSATTAQLISAHSLTTKQVYVVPNAADVTPANHSVASALEREKSIVYMGSFMPYKNVETLVRALHELPGFQLHLMSRLTDSDQRRLVALAPSNSLVFHNGATDEEYFEILGQATALVSASRDEGFGIPLVEAMSVGTPVVVSDIEIFHEIGGDAALYADSDSPHSFARQIMSLSNPDRWLEASQASLRQGATFNWDRSARKLLNVLVEVGSSQR